MIHVQNLSKSFNDSVPVLDGLSFELSRGGICSVVGPTGSGKSTLLNIIAGLEQPDCRGMLIVEDPECVMGYMTQDAQLLPWRTLEDNAVLGYEVIHKERPNSTKIMCWFQGFGLWEERHKLPNQTSGGMKQRAALIRSLLFSPTMLLLDEPFSGLDFDIKLRVQKQLVEYQKKSDATMLLVTHDIEDAIALSDTVIVLSNKPSHIKLEIDIDLGIRARDPVEARKSTRFRDYFVKIWDELKYLDAEDEAKQA